MAALGIVEGELQNLLSRKSVLVDGSLDFNCIPPSRNVFFLAWIDAALDEDFSVLPASDKVQASNSSTSKIDSKTPPKRSSERRKTTTMRTRSDAAKASSEGMNVINSKLGCR